MTSGRRPRPLGGRSHARRSSLPPRHSGQPQQEYGERQQHEQEVQSYQNSYIHGGRVGFKTQAAEEGLPADVRDLHRRGIGLHTWDRNSAVSRAANR